MLRVGLTGGLASGKSTVARRLAERGIPVLDADRVVHALYAPGGAGARAVAALFGPGTLAPDGSVDRPAVARLVFGDAAAVARLNAAVHPLVHAEEARWFEDRAAGGARVGVVEATLLLESGGRALYDLVVVVSAPAEARLARASLRDPSRGEAELKGRMAAQMPDAERDKAADILVENAGGLEELLAKADALADDLTARSAAREGA